MSPEAIAPEEPRPDVTIEAACVLAETRYGISGDVRELGSQQDRNFRFTTATGRYLLKVANPAFSFTELEAQNLAMAALSAAGIAAPVPIASLAGAYLEPLSERGEHVRLSSFVEGEPLTGAGYLAPEVVADLGTLCARTIVALSDLDHPGLDRTLQWDLRHAGAVIAELAGWIADSERRAQVERAASLAWDNVNRATELRIGPIHGDLTDDNVVCGTGADGRLHPFGVIDLGDLARSWLVGELAITCSSVLHHNPANPLAIIDAVVAFNNVIELTESELDVLWDLIILRGAVLAVSGEHQVAQDPTNTYAAENLPHEWLVFDIATSVPAPVATAAIRAALGRLSGPSTLVTPKHPIVAVPADKVFDVDLSVTSPQLAAGRWLEPDCENALFANRARGSVGIARYGVPRLTRSTLNSNDEPVNVPLHVELALPGTAVLVAPASGTVVRSSRSELVLRTRTYDLYLSNVRPLANLKDKVRAGLPIASPARGRDARPTVQISLDRSVVPPLFCTASMFDAWCTVCPDPSVLMGLETEPRPTRDDVLAARKASLGDVTHHYYAEPPLIERGWRTHLVDSNARPYLDVVNNVASVGHCHPRIASAAGEQWQLLNTNSRFHYPEISDYATRLVELAPPPLDTVLFVNSGTEAVDLAIRMAQICTGHRNVVAHAEAYHGWSMAADGVSASTADNPVALTTRPDWAKFVAAPNWYRGTYRGFDSGAPYVADAAESIAVWAMAGGIAGFICEPVFGNGGGILLPEGYLTGMYDLIRSYGGLCISDEVQVGLGRLGEYFWGCEQQGVVPDVITTAKSLGNGQPIGAVLTRRDIADSLTKEGNVFSSAGGNPVSCRIGSTVLDILRDEDLPANAATVGSYLQERLLELSERHPIIGAVHGMGLYLGVELVRDRTSMEPASTEAAAICDRLLELGIIEQPTGDRFNVLKLKPPMSMTKSDADFYVETLDEVLSRGW